jgi:hypothetical protein
MFMRHLLLSIVFILMFMHLFLFLDLDYVVSPYEADAQLAFLFANKKIAAVMTSDADLFVYGVTVIIFPPFKKNCHVIDGKSKLQNGVFDFRASIAAACRLHQSRDAISSLAPPSPVSAASLPPPGYTESASIFATIIASDEISEDEVESGEWEPLDSDELDSLVQFLDIIHHLGALGLALVAVVTGCDYCAGVTGISMAVSAVHSVVANRRSTGCTDVSSSSLSLNIPDDVSEASVQALLELIIKNLTPVGQRKVQAFLLKNKYHFLDAALVFLKQIVYDPETKKRMPFRMIGVSLGFVGPESESAGRLEIPGRDLLFLIICYYHDYDIYFH